MYFAAIAVGIFGALIVRLQTLGMARTMFAMTLVQVVITAIALIAGLGLPYSGPLELIGLNGFFVASFTGSAWLFQRAAQERLERGGA